MVGIVLIGDEILSASVREENLHIMLTTLVDLGYEIGEVRIVRDVVEEIARAVREVRERSEFIITAGGIGPTHDDLTLDGVAAAFGTPVSMQPDMVRFLESRYGTPLTPMVARMAQMPVGTEVIGADEGHWPVIRWSGIYILPGLPRALVDKMERLPAIIDQRERFHTAALYLDADESLFADWLTAAVARVKGVSVGSYPVVGDYDYRSRIVLRGVDGAAVMTVADRFAVHFESLGVLVRREGG